MFAVNSPGLVGWTLESPGRGTLSLLATCLATTALCTWIVIHPRISTRKKHRFPHKVALWLKTILAPELIAVEAAQEWMQARRVVRQCEGLTKGQFRMIHSYYIGMFGLRYRTLAGSRILWPNQFVWLLEQRLLDWKQCCDGPLSVEGIKDKSNADGTAKMFALAQVIWFMAQSIIRAIHKLPLAPLESMTLSYIPLFAIAYAYWWIKPKDVKTPSEIGLPDMDDEQQATFESLAVDDRFDDEGTSEQKSLRVIWALTPRIFEKDAEDQDMEDKQIIYMEQRRHHQKHVTYCSDSECRVADHEKPLPPVRGKELKLSHWDPELYHSLLWWPLCCLAGVSFPALHLISWGARFPTLLEIWLWRASALASMAGILVFMHFEKVVISWRDPLVIIKILSPMIYLVARLVLLVGAFAALRASDPGVYQTYVVSNYWAQRG